jgi:hypothetical protein
MSSILTAIFLGMAAAPVAVPPPISAELAKVSALVRVEPMERYLELVSVDPDCKRERKPDEITVCGRRDADRYRVPLLIPQDGDPRNEGVHGERERLQHITNACDAKGPFLIGCGGVGIGVSTNFSGQRVRYRPLAK